MMHTLKLLALLTLLVLGAAGVAYVITNFICPPVEGGPYGDQSSYQDEPLSPPAGYLNHLGSPASQP